MNSSFKHFFIYSLLLFVFVQCKPAGDEQLRTESGYDFYRTHKGDGVMPNKGDFVFFEMDIKDSDGKVLQSMRGLPEMPSAQIPLERSTTKQKNAVLDMLAMSSVGDSLELIVPIDSMPGAEMQFPNATHFEYHVNVEKIVDKETYTADLAKKQEAAEAAVEGVATMVATTLSDYKAGKLDVKKTASGLEYVIHEEGSGSTVPVGEKLTANYYGVVKSDGSMFDNSFSKGRPFTFTLGRGEVIAGWDEGMALIKKGGSATLFIPYKMAYGEQGRPPQIPAKADLVFYVEVI